MKTHQGGGNPNEGEFIELFELKLENIRNFIRYDVDHQKPQGLLFALMWFLYEKESYFKEKNQSN